MADEIVAQPMEEEVVDTTEVPAEKEVVSTAEKEVVSTAEKEVVSTAEKEVVSTAEEEVVSTAEKEVVSTAEKEVVCTAEEEASELSQSTAAVGGTNGNAVGAPFSLNGEVVASRSSAVVDPPVVHNVGSSGEERAGPSNVAKERKRGYKTLRMQPSRVKRVMQTDEETGRMHASVPAALASSLERFIELLVSQSGKVVNATKSRTVHPSHLKAAVVSIESLDFLLEEFEDVQDCPNAANIVQALTSVPLTIEYGKATSSLTVTPAPKIKKVKLPPLNEANELPAKRSGRDKTYFAKPEHDSSPSIRRARRQGTKTGRGANSNGEADPPLPPSTFGAVSQLSTDQRITLVTDFYKSKRNALHAQEQWRRHVKEEPIPSIELVLTVVQLFESTGTVMGLAPKAATNA